MEAVGSNRRQTALHLLLHSLFFAQLDQLEPSWKTTAPDAHDAHLMRKSAATPFRDSSSHIT